MSIHAFIKGLIPGSFSAPKPPRAVPAPAPPPPAVPLPDEDDEESLIYPPSRKGLPASCVDDILERYAPMINRIWDAMGCDEEDFEGLVRPVIRRFAAFVHLLPASEVHHHRGPGGLLQHSLEVARLAAESSARHVWCADRPPNEKYHIEPRWRVAAGIAGLIHDLGKPVGDLAVGSLDGKTLWSPYRGPLAQWLAHADMQRYYLHWRDTRRHNQHEMMAGQVVNLVLTPALLDYFDRDPEIHPAVLGVATGTAKKTSLLAGIVLKADQASVAADLKEHRYNPNALSLGVPVDRYLVDAMRRLAKRGIWTCNAPGSRLWMLSDGLHVVWPQGGDEIIAELDEDRVPGIPKMHESIADILVDRGHVVSWQEDGRTRFYRKVAPGPLVRDAKPVHLTTLLLSTPDLVFPGHPPAPVGIWTEGGILSAPHPTGETSRVSASPLDGQEHREATAQEGSARGPGGDTDNDAEPLDTRAEEGGAGAAETREPETPQGTTGTPPKAAESNSAPKQPQVSDRIVKERAWLSKRGGGGRVLLTLADAIAEGTRPAAHVLVRDNTLRLPYPEALADLPVEGLDTTPGALRAALWNDGLILVDPMRPFVQLQVIDGHSWAVLTSEASRAMGALVEPVAPGAQAAAVTGGEDTVPESVPQAPPGAPSAQDGEAPEQDRARMTPISKPRSQPASQHRQSVKALAAQFIAQCESGVVVTTPIPEGLLVDSEVLAEVAKQLGMQTAKLIGKLTHSDRIAAHPHGLIVIPGRQ